MAKNWALRSNLNIINSWYVTKFSRDIYLPSLPAIMVGLHTTSTYVKYTVMMYYFGLAFSRFFWTPLSDIFGRRIIILSSLPIFIVGSIICATSFDIWLFMLGRLMQALGIGCVTSIGRAMITDVYGERKSTKALTYLSLFGLWAPAVATVLGGHLQHWFSWRASFIFLFICGSILYLQSYFVLRETITEKLPAKRVFKQIAKNYKILLSSKEYLRYLFCFSFIFAGTVVYYTASPFLFIHEMHIKSYIYGYFAFVTVSGILFGKLMSAHLNDYYGIEHIMIFSILISLVGGLALIGSSIVAKPSIAGIMAPTFIYFIGMGAMSPISKTATMCIIPKTAGTASALFGTAQGLVSGFASMITANVHNKNGLPMGILFTNLAILALLFFFMLKPKNGKTFNYGESD